LGVTKKDLNLTKSIGEAPQIITKDWSKLNYPIRSEVSHKKSFGSHLIIAGSDKYPGAALLCAKSSNLSGAGLTTVASTSKIIEKIIKDVPETTFLPLNNTKDLDLLFSEKIGLYDSISVGSGLDTNEYSKNIILNLINYYKGLKSNQKLILDADGINILADFNYWWEDLPKSTILTPHMGEMERISGVNKKDLNLKKLIQITKRWNKTIVMKGPNTYISSPDKGVMINTCPNGGMSKPGIGDVLTGMIGSVSSSTNLNTLITSSLSVYIHSIAGELARNKFGSTSMTASNVISFIPQAFKFLQE
jgi:NAD(P)H-hydrate epimerase